MADADAPCLIVEGGPLDAAEMKLAEGMTVIVGSGRLANLRLDHPDIELAHIKVRWDETGVSMVDNGSRNGTWLNREPVETAALIDGDVIMFVDPAGKSTAPRVRVTVPASLMPAPLAPPPPPPAAARPAAARASEARSAKPKSRTAGRSWPGVSLPGLRVVGIAVAGTVLLGLVAWAAVQLVLRGPAISSIEPSQCEPGCTVTIRGRRLGSDAAQIGISFGTWRVPASSVDGEAAQAVVPPLPGGAVPVVVEVGGRTSNALQFVALVPLRARALVPPGAVPGDEVALEGGGLEDGAEVSVGDLAARVLAIEPARIRFVMPAADAVKGSTLPVVVTLRGRRTSPLQIVFGRVPLVTSFEPERAAVADSIVVRGAGFSADPAANAVTVDGVRALVAAATASALTVVLPPMTRVLPEIQAPIVVSAGGRTSEAAVYPVLRVIEGTWVPRFIPVPGESPGQVAIVTEAAPVLLLSSKAEVRSVAVRALRLASALDDVVAQARSGGKIALEARQEPAGVAIAGNPDLLLQVTHEDTLAYRSSPAAEPPAEAALARHWAALLTDYVAVGTSNVQPSAVAALSPAAGAALAQLRAALPWQYGLGVGNARVAALSPALREKLKAAAMVVP